MDAATELLSLEPLPTPSSSEHLETVHACTYRCLLSAVIEGDFQRGEQFGTNDEQDSVLLQWCVLDPLAIIV